MCFSSLYKHGLCKRLNLHTKAINPQLCYSERLLSDILAHITCTMQNNNVQQTCQKDLIQKKKKRLHILSKISSGFFPPFFFFCMCVFVGGEGVLLVCLFVLGGSGGPQALKFAADQLQYVFFSLLKTLPCSLHLAPFFLYKIVWLADLLIGLNGCLVN